GSDCHPDQQRREARRRDRPAPGQTTDAAPVGRRRRVRRLHLQIRARGSGRDRRHDRGNRRRQAGGRPDEPGIGRRLRSRLRRRPRRRRLQGPKSQRRERLRLRFELQRL
ncbi:MAG: probable iron binding protein from the HesB_IscA_SufA family, partial [uncultured Sphingomonas sp.]